MKVNHIYILFFLFLVASVPTAIYGNSERKYCENILDSARKGYSRRDYVESLQNLIKAKQLAEESNWTDLEIDALNGIGTVYADLFDYDKAMEYYLESYKIALKESDKKRELLIINNIAKIYFINKDYSKAKEYTEMAYQIAIYLNDSSRIGLLSSNLASILHKTEDFALAEKYINISLKMLNGDTNKPEYLTSQIIKTENLYLQKKYSEAEQIGISTWKQLQKTEHTFKPYFILILSKIYQEKGDFKRAIDYAKKALKSKPDIQTCIDIYTHLSDLYLLNDACSLALQYKDSAIMALDSLRKVNNSDYLESNLIRFELINSEKQLSENRIKQRTDRITFAVIAFFILLLASFLLWMQSIKNKQKKLFELERGKNEKLLLEQKLKERETLALLEQERFKNEIENKNKQLIANTLFQSNRNKLIKELIEAFSTTPLQSEGSILKSIIKKLKVQLEDYGDVNNFLRQFEQINPSLLLLLKEKHSNLSHEDIHLLSYVYLDMDIKKIAHLLNISVSACQKRKERLAVKLGINTIDLYKYLLSIMQSSNSKDLS